MKPLVFCLILLNLPYVSAKDYAFELKVTDAYSGKAIANCTVSFRSIKDDSDEAKTDSTGFVKFSQIKEKHLTVTIDYPGLEYERRQFEVYLNKKSTNLYFMSLYPGKSFYDKLLLEEDRKYGKADEKISFIEGMNGKPDDGIICDSTKSEYAEFPGGNNELMKFISKNVNYPVECIERGDQGKVYLKFIVEPDGNISHVKVVRGNIPELNAESIRVIRQMPKWKPGTCDGHPTRLMMMLPINFTLQ